MRLLLFAISERLLYLSLCVIVATFYSFLRAGDLFFFFAKMEKISLINISKIYLIVIEGVPGPVFFRKESGWQHTKKSHGFNSYSVMNGSKT